MPTLSWRPAAIATVLGTILHVAVDGQWLGAIRLADTVREESRPLCSELRTLGIDRIAMMTGDRVRVARAIATDLGIEEVRAECLPEEKQQAVNDL